MYRLENCRLGATIISSHSTPNTHRIVNVPMDEQLIIDLAVHQISNSLLVFFRIKIEIRVPGIKI